MTHSLLCTGLSCLLLFSGKSLHFFSWIPTSIIFKTCIGLFFLGANAWNELKCILVVLSSQTCLRIFFLFFLFLRFHFTISKTTLFIIPYHFIILYHTQHSNVYFLTQHIKIIYLHNKIYFCLSLICLSSSPLSLLS